MKYEREEEKMWNYPDWCTRSVKRQYIDSIEPRGSGRSRAEEECEMMMREQRRRAALYRHEEEIRCGILSGE